MPWSIRNNGASTAEYNFEEFLAGADQSKTFGHYRLHVSADNAFAVAAGIALFGEPKFLASFNYAVPALNDPTV